MVCHGTKGSDKESAGPLLPWSGFDRTRRRVRRETAGLLEHALQLRHFGGQLSVAGFLLVDPSSLLRHALGEMFNPPGLLLVLTEIPSAVGNSASAAR